MICLLSFKLDLIANQVSYGSLTAVYIRTKVSIKEITQPNKTPVEQLIGIYTDEDIKAPMPTTLVTGICSKLTSFRYKKFDLDLLLKASWTYSENVTQKELPPIKV